MDAFLNDRFVPETEARVSIFDRGFLYGDGLFETIRVVQSRMLGWEAHFERLERGAHLLGIHLPFDARQAEATALELARRNGLTEGVLRLQVTRGCGARGYSPRGASAPTVTLTAHPLEALGDEPRRWRLHTASFRLDATDPLARTKSCNRLLGILARAEAEAQGAHEALLVNAAGAVVEAVSANVFWIERDTIHTPPLSLGALPGVTRAQIIRLARTQDLTVLESSGSTARLQNAAGAFLTLSSYGIVEIESLDGHLLGSSPLTRTLYRAYVAEASAPPPSGPR